MKPRGIPLLFSFLLAISVGNANAETFRTGHLYVSDYGLSTLDRYQYTYDETLNFITGFMAAVLAEVRPTRIFRATRIIPSKRAFTARQTIWR